MENILCLIYLVAHTVAALLSEILECCVVLAAYDLGMTAWGLTALWLALIVLDLLGWISVRKPEWRILAAALFPVLCGAMDVLFRSKAGQPPAEVSAQFLALLLLAGYILLAREQNDQRPGWEQGLALLERGSEINVFLLLWPALLGGGILFMGTIGILFSLIIGGLIAARNNLLDYNGTVGFLLGLLGLYLIQAVLFLRAWRLTEEEDRAEPWFTLLVSIWNLVQARRLTNRLWRRKWTAEGYDHF